MAFSLRSRRLGFLISLSCVAALLDQITKFWAVKHLTILFESASPHTMREQIALFWRARHPFASAPITVSERFWDFMYVENSGAAWSLLANVDESIRGPIFLIISLIAAVVILKIYFDTPGVGHLRAWAAVLALGGAIGNFVDRFRMKYVIDFIHWHIGERYHWPVFNIADVFITMGMLALFLDALLRKEKTHS